MTIVKAVLTCRACPSQWDAWTDTGQYLYLRYRWGRGTVETYPSPDVDEWAISDEALIAEFEDPNEFAGEIGLEEFCQRAGLVLDLTPIEA